MIHTPATRVACSSCDDVGTVNLLQTHDGWHVPRVPQNAGGWLLNEPNDTAYCPACVKQREHSARVGAALKAAGLCKDL